MGATRRNEKEVVSHFIAQWVTREREGLETMTIQRVTLVKVSYYQPSVYFHPPWFSVMWRQPSILCSNIFEGFLRGVVPTSGDIHVYFTRLQNVFRYKFDSTWTNGHSAHFTGLLKCSHSHNQMVCCTESSEKTFFSVKVRHSQITLVCWLDKPFDYQRLSKAGIIQSTQETKHQQSFISQLAAVKPRL